MKFTASAARGAIKYAAFVVTLSFRRALTRWRRRLRIGASRPESDRSKRCRLCLGYSSRAPEPDGYCFDCPKRTHG